MDSLRLYSARLGWKTSQRTEAKVTATRKWRDRKKQEQRALAGTKKLVSQTSLPPSALPLPTIEPPQGPRFNTSFRPSVADNPFEASSSQPSRPILNRPDVQSQPDAADRRFSTPAFEDSMKGWFELPTAPPSIPETALIDSEAQAGLDLDRYFREASFDTEYSVTTSCDQDGSPGSTV